MTMLEKLLEAIVGLTNALNAHAAALAANPTAAPAAKKAKGAATETAAPAAGITAAPTAAQPTQAATQTNVLPAATVAAPTAAAVSAQEAGTAMVRVANEVNRDAAVAILAKYGAAAFAGVKPEHYAAFKADCDAALAQKAAPPSGAAGLL